MTADSLYRVWFGRVLGGRKVVRVAEGEDEHVLVLFGGVAGVPRKRGISTKEMIVV